MSRNNRAAQNAAAQPPEQPLATPQEVADYLNDIPVKTLAEWRSRGIGPRYRKVGRHVRYDWADVLAWVAETSPRPAA